MTHIYRVQATHLSIGASLEPISQFSCTSFAAIFSFRLYFVTMAGSESTLINFINNNELQSAFSRIHSKSNSRNKKICPDKIINLIWNLFWACRMHQCRSFHFHSRQRCRTLHQWMENISTVWICLTNQCEDGCLDLWISTASHWINISPVIKTS